ncbi:ABC transporter substrate-binding protein [Amycolatopsis sp. 3B14]|uniref:ABC transporter substrate-binding protein n=1 Tax=Amycolatopsis sp. 3B14 TaxID=3243600 RepID=UPI003D96A0FE
MRGKRSVAALSGAVLVTLATACGSGQDGGSAAADGTCTPDRAGGTVTMGTYSEPRGLDPVGQPGNAVTGGTEITALFDTLIDWNATKQAYEPRVAQSLEPDAGFVHWTLTLRPGVKFGNGDPLTADDVKASIARHQAPDNAQASRGEVAVVSAVDVVDPHTVRFTLNAPYPDFPHVLATDVGMITNPRVVQQRGADGFAKNPAGGGVGPYEVERYAPGEEIVLKAKPDYWGGPVCVQTLRFVRVAGAEATYQALANGELDVAFLREPQVIAEARQAGYHDLSTLINYGEGVIMNSAAGKATANLTVRRAVVAAVDPQGVNQRVFNGTAPATSALVHPDTPGLYGGEQGPAHDPALARQLVAQGRAAGWDGTIGLVADNTPTRVNEAIAVKAQLESVGFTVRMDTSQPLQDVIKRVTVDRDYELALWGPQFFAEGTWASINRQLNSASPANYYSYRNPDIDHELGELRAAASTDEKKAVLGRMQLAFNADPFAANLAAVEESVVHRDRVGGLQLSRGSIVRFDKAFVSDGS